ncbi:AAA family ATPase [Haliangium sp.]|uniref:AAA family ATPase n=1 Tax=Haliangium sp. TaxID=2663208 RepID=UPI003D0AB957
MDIARPRGEVADLLEGGHRQERFRDIVLPEVTLDLLSRIVRENRARAELEQWQVTPRRRLLFQGPPGCGKTLAAAVLAGELGLPLMTVRFDALFSRFLGATANHLRLIFDELPRRPGVYLFDEFDAVGQRRAHEQDVGEMRRIVTSFLQLIDTDRSASLIIAATNHPELLDRAVFRRFDVEIGFELPNAAQLAQLLALRLTPFDISKTFLKQVAERVSGLSYADAARACDDAIRAMVLDGASALSESYLVCALEDMHRKHERRAASSPSK